MPLYEFECLKCGIVFEKLVRKVGAVSDVVCPECGSPKVQQQISTFASFVKGGAANSSGNCAPSGGG